MPVTSAQLYVQGLLVGLTPPGDTGIYGAIDALITPLDPDVQPDGIARVYVWPTEGDVKRLAMPRNTGMGTQAGWKEVPHHLDVFMTWMNDPDDQNADVNFPLLIDWVWAILETSPNPAQWIDPETGLVSQFVNLGEIMKYSYPPPRSLEPQTWRRYDARIQCNLWELYQR